MSDSHRAAALPSNGVPYFLFAYAGQIAGANLLGAAATEYVVWSNGPISNAGRPADLQVLSWDRSAARWNLLFDAGRDMEQIRGPGPSVSAQSLLPSDATDDVLQVMRLQMHPAVQEQLVFSVSVRPGNHASGGVCVLDYESGGLDVGFWQFLQRPARIAARGQVPNQELEISHRG